MKITGSFNIQVQNLSNVRDSAPVVPLLATSNYQERKICGVFVADQNFFGFPVAPGVNALPASNGAVAFLTLVSLSGEKIMYNVPSSFLRPVGWPRLLMFAPCKIDWLKSSLRFSRPALYSNAPQAQFTLTAFTVD